MEGADAWSKETVELHLQQFAKDKLGIAFPLELYTTLAVLLVTLFFLLLVARAAFRRKKPDTILLVGLSGAGKTALFYQLRDGSTHKGTVTSMEANVDRFILHSESIKQEKIKPVRIVDVPGHLRLRSKLDDFLTEAGGIVFLVDAADFMPNVRETAEYLYEVLSKAWLVMKKVPVLVVCNKMDKVTAHSTDFIRKQLEKEIDKLRVTRNAVSAADMASEVSLGKEGESFKFSQCVNKVTVVEASVITNRITDIQQFIRDQTGR